jgi:hypothetical protein
MKKIILLLAGGFLAITVNAQKIAESAVAPGVKAAFVKMYPTAAVTSWTKEPINNVRAEFINAGVPTTVLMGPNNNLLQTVVEIKTSELPKDAADFCTGKTITKSYKVTSNTGVISYKAMGDKEYLFDTNGKIAVK